MENSLNISQVGPIGRVAIITLTSLVLKFLPHALPPISPLGYMKNNILLCGGDRAVMRWWCSVFFLLWTLKVPVNHGFWHLFTGTFLCTRAFFQKNHGQVVQFTGTFLDVFTGTFSGFTGKKSQMFTDTFGCSRAYFDIQGFMFTGTCQCSRALLPKKIKFVLTKFLVTVKNEQTIPCYSIP